MLWTRMRKPDAERVCGECHACCVVLGFDTRDGESTFNKAEGEPCPHLIQIGCGIYEERPPVCRRFRCVWLNAPSLPEELRPDRCGVMFWTNTSQTGEGYSVYAYELRPGAARSPLVTWLIGEISRNGTTVVIVRPNAPSETTAPADDDTEG